MEEKRDEDESRKSLTASRRWTALLVFAGYLSLAQILWWHVWTIGPRHAVTCSCSDSARFIWFFKWPEFALTHGLNPFFSTYLFHPTGINLFNDSSVLGLSLPLVPITAIFGPVFSVNLISTLTPVLTAFTMFVLVRRWVTWTPSAIIAGLLFGFSPAMLVGLAYTQLNLVFLAAIPLIILVVDELVRRQVVAPLRLGLGLGVLLVAQFLISPEILLITALMCSAAIVPLWWAVSRRSDEQRLSLRYVLQVGATGLAVAGVGLTIPIAYFFFGPGHLSGPIWGTNAELWQFGTTPGSFLNLGKPTSSTAANVEAFWGHFGAQLPSAIVVGPGLLALGALGLILWRRDRILQFFAVVGIVAAALSLRPGSLAWVPWNEVRRIPLFNNIVEVRFDFVVFFCVAVVAARTLDDLRAHLKSWPALRSSHWSTVLTLSVAAASILPAAWAMAPDFPLTLTRLDTPRWFQTTGRHLPPHQVLLTFPFPSSGRQGSQAWQAVTGMPWMQVGGGGPTSIAERAGPAIEGYAVLVDITGSLRPPLPLTAARVRAVRTALGYWGVTKIVVPVQETLTASNRGRSTPLTVGFVSAVVGTLPRGEDGAWVWSLSKSRQALTMRPGSNVVRYNDCTKLLTMTRSKDMARCVLGQQTS